MANLKAKFQKLAVKMITKTFESVAQDVIIRRPLYNNYDEASGSLISAYEDYTVKGIVGPWVDDDKAAANSDKVRSDESSLLIATTLLEIIPELNVDIAITIDGTEWAIIDSITDEAGASTLFKLSKGVEE